MNVATIRSMFCLHITTMRVKKACPNMPKGCRNEVQGTNSRLIGNTERPVTQT